MSKGNTFENDLLKLIFNATAIANIADNASVSPLTNLVVSLHTADVGEGGSQTTNEIAYGAYARQNVARTTAGWLVTGSTVYLQNNLAFPTPTSGSGTVTHFAVGTATSGAGKVLYKGTVTPNITVSTSFAPTLTTGSNMTED